MSFLSTTLQRRAEIRHLNQTDIARQSGISRSNISRLFGGEFSDMSDDNFAALLNVFVTDARAQAEIIAARCEDTLEVARAAKIRGAELVKISIKTADANSHNGDPVAPGIQLSEQTERAFAWFRSQCPTNPDLEKHLVSFARLMGMT
jgi:predicted XRE-type DNA-binding protein